MRSLHFWQQDVRLNHPRNPPAWSHVTRSCLFLRSTTRKVSCFFWPVQALEFPQNTTCSIHCIFPFALFGPRGHQLRLGMFQRDKPSRWSHAPIIRHRPAGVPTRASNFQAHRVDSFLRDPLSVGPWKEPPGWLGFVIALWPISGFRLPAFGWPVAKWRKAPLWPLSACAGRLTNFAAETIDAS